MHGGGFDVIIGNPPYVEIPKISGQYSLQKNEMTQAGNLYAVCVKRFSDLLRLKGMYGVIVPISSVSTPRMLPLMRLLVDDSSSVYVSNFAVRPSKLFVGVDMNLSILIGTRRVAKGRCPIFTTSYKRWNEVARKHLFATVSYTESGFHEPLAAISKIGSETDRTILGKLTKHQPLARFRRQESSNPVFYHSGGRYFRKCIRTKLSNEYKELPLSGEAANPILCLLSSSLYYWLWLALSDCYHVTRTDIDTIAVPDSVIMDDGLHALADALVDDLERNSEVRVRRRADGSEQREVNYIVGKSKKLIDEIDHALARHYGFTDEELDFIINYDIKYRMGRDQIEQR